MHGVEELRVLRKVCCILGDADVHGVAGQEDEVGVSAPSIRPGTVHRGAIENSQNTHPMARAFAHDIIDAGADMILGHHPHVPRGVEVYRGKVIFYSLGNLIFGHSHDYWMDNYVARLTLTPERIAVVQILPVAGKGRNLAQPYVLSGADARSVLEDIQTRSEALDTRMEIQGDVGVILPGETIR